MFINTKFIVNFANSVNVFLKNYYENLFYYFDITSIINKSELF